MTDEELKARARKRRTMLQVAVVLIWAIWATLPPDEIAFDADCAPEGGPASVSAFLYGKWFWRRQLDADIVETERLLALNGQQELQGEEERLKVDDRMNHLNKGDVRNADPDERKHREEAEQTKRLLRLAWLAQCRAGMETIVGEAR